MTDVMIRAATISQCGLFRYSLERVWDERGSRVLWICLNPSVASAEIDDPSARKMVGFARQWSHGSVEVVNLYAFRATDPKYLARAGCPVGPENDAHIREAIGRAALIVCAWGAHEHRDSLRPPAIRKMLDAAGRHAVCLGRTASGQPKHPLYVPYETPCETYYTGNYGR